MRGRTRAKNFLVVGKIEEYAYLLEKLQKVVTCHLLDRDESYDGIIILGGDGTVLRTLSRYKDPPVVYAINCGKVGFLCPIMRSEIDELIRRFEAGDEMKYFVSKRLCLSPDKYFLNEAIIRSSQPEKLSTFRVHVNKMFFAIKADAIIVSTRAGSSGYNMSVGVPFFYSKELSLMLLLQLGVASGRLYANSPLKSA